MDYEMRDLQVVWMGEKSVVVWLKNSRLDRVGVEVGEWMERK